MARRNRSSRRKSSYEMLLLSLVGFLLLVVVFFVFINKNQDVKSAQDYRATLNNYKNDSTKSGRIKTCLKDSRITSFSVNGVCDNRDKDAFTKATYTCQDGSSGTIDKGCLGAAALLAHAKIACARTVCPTVTLPPRPSITPKPVTTR